MTYWQNGKLILLDAKHDSGRPAVARWLGIKPTDIVLISSARWAFGSKVADRR